MATEGLPIRARGRACILTYVSDKGNIDLNPKKTNTSQGYIRNKQRKKGKLEEEKEVFGRG